MGEVQFPIYKLREISGAANIGDIGSEDLPEPMRFDLMRWKNTFARRCDEQLRSVQTENGAFVEARLVSKWAYMGMPTQYSHNIMYHENTDDGSIRLQEHLLEPTNFTPVSCASREATAIIERIDVKNPKSITEDALILHLIQNGVTTEELQSLYLRKPQWFTNEVPARWYAMLKRGEDLEVTSFVSNFFTRARSIFSRPKLESAFTKTISIKPEVSES